MRDMTMKRNARQVHRNIRDHHIRNSPIYHELAHAPEGIRQAFLNDLANPLLRRYAENRVSEASFDLALTRIDQLDPHPYEHQHPGCSAHGMRSKEPDAEGLDVFAPRDGYITNIEAYRD